MKEIQGMRFFKHKSKLLITDPYLLRFELADNYTPERNPDVQKILDEISNNQKQNNEPPLNETLPFASFKTAEDFFNRLRLIAAKEAMPIKFAYFAIWKYDQTQKVKIGKKNSGKGNPHEYISFNKPGYEFLISSEYQNMTTQLFEVIFNDPDNIDTSYEDKITYCKALRQAYLDSTKVADDEVAKLPSLDEVENGPVSLQIPALTPSKNKVKDNLVYDATTGKFFDPKIANQERQEKKSKSVTNKTNSQVTVNSQGVRTFDQPGKPKMADHKEKNTTKSKRVPQAPARRAIRKNIQNEVEEQTNLAREKGHIDAPQFAIEELESVEPGHPGYVEYWVNQKKKGFNKELQKIAKEISNKNEKAIINSRSNFSKSVDSAIDKLKKQHANDADNIFNRIQEDMKNKKDVEYHKQVDAVDSNLQELLKQAAAEYQQKISNLKHKAKQNKVQIEEKLTKKYTALAEQVFTKDLTKHDKDLQTVKQDLIHKLTLKFELLSREQAAQLRADGDRVLQEAFGKMNDQLTDLRIRANKVNNEAKAVNISQQRVENEKLRLESPSTDLKEAQVKLQSLQAKLATAQTNYERYKKISDDQEATLHANKAEIKRLNEEINNMTTKQATDKVNKTNNKFADMLNNLIALQVAQQMGKTNPDKGQQLSSQQQVQSATNDDQLKLAMKGFKRLALGLSTVIVLLIAGGGYLLVNQQNKYNQQLATTTKTMDAKIATAKQQAQPMSQSEANRKALVALHENSNEKLDQYSNEKYYDLDKAIIANNATEANNAVKALGSDLNLQDHYRATQAQALLQKAGNPSLATKVGDANK